VKFWIDECLTPTLVGHAHSHGYEATSTRDRGQLGMGDDELLALAVSEEFVFVTNNHADFVGLCTNAELRTGLVVLPQRPRDAQFPAMPSLTSSTTPRRLPKRQPTGCSIASWKSMTNPRHAETCRSPTAEVPPSRD
jgi:Domain of unknown function (DUF5615)